MGYRRLPSSLLALALALALACAEASDEFGQARGSSSAGQGGAAGAAGAADVVGGSPAVGVAGAAEEAGSGGTGLTSDVFGNGGSTGEGGATAACEYPSPPSCDWTRVEGCCQPLACERANGGDVFNTYPIESCQALVACVQANPGCSNAADPLCFQDEDPDAPCLMEAYQASHTDPDGPFAWTVELVNCVCGY